MRPQLVQVVHIVLDREIEAPGIVHARLPYVTSDAVLFDAEGRMVEVFEQER